MSTLLRFATLCGVTMLAASAAQALPLTPVPGSGPPFDANLRGSLSPNLAPWQDWSGFHVGVNVGGAWNGAPTAAFLALPAIRTADFGAAAVLTHSLSGSGAGAIGGAQIGYDFEWPFGLVSGVEADFQGLSFRDTAWASAAFATSETGAVKATKRVDSLGTVRLRLGYQVTPGILFYGAGGYAFGRVVFTASGAVVNFPLNLAAASITNYAGLRGGFAAGGGVEYTISPHLIGRVEYLRYDLGAAYAPSPLLTSDASLLWPGVAQRTEVKFSGNILRAGVNYRFSPELTAPNAPAVAAY